MCHLCLQLEKEFAKFKSPVPKVNNDLATKYLKYLSLNPEQRCEFVKKFDFSVFTKTNDDDIMHGVRWDEKLDEYFKEIDDLWKRVEVKKEETPEIKIEVAPPEPPAAEIKAVEPPTCVHDWLLYQGAGTIKPETICKKCGCPKSDNKASP